MNRKEILEKARVCVCGEREQDYGSPENNFATIAALWAAYLYPKLGECAGEITAADVAAMMALLKIGRIAGGSRSPDNWIDLAGYAACGGEIVDGERLKEACDHLGMEALKLGVAEMARAAGRLPILGSRKRDDTQRDMEG